MSERPSLQQLLENSVSGRPDSVREFLHKFWQGKVFVPLRLKAGEGGQSSALQAHTQYLVSQTEGGAVIPIFSDAKFIAEWSGRELPYEETEVKALLWSIGDNLRLHLNPGQEVGKEFSPWEIEQLRLGEEAIAEIVEDLCVTENINFEVIETDLPEAVRKRLLLLLESYAGVQEAFYLMMRSSDDGVAFPVIGLKVVGLADEKRQQLIGEIRQEFRTNEDLGSKIGELAIFDDLASELSANKKVFQDRTPFYFASKTFNLTSSRPTVFQLIKSYLSKEPK